MQPYAMHCIPVFRDDILKKTVNKDILKLWLYFLMIRPIPTIVVDEINLDFLWKKWESTKLLDGIRFLNNL
jgi:hypothetical protein